MYRPLVLLVFLAAYIGVCALHRRYRPGTPDDPVIYKLPRVTVAPPVPYGHPAAPTQEAR